jgi:hypothetical protein
MNETKDLYIRKNVRAYVDMDYLKSLPPKERAFMQKFIDEYYCGGYYKEGSLHRKAFGKDYELKIKKQMVKKMNAENRDVEGIAKCAKMTDNLDDFVDGLITTKDESITAALKTKTPQLAMNDLIAEYADLARSEADSAEKIMREFSFKAITLFLLVKKAKANAKAEANRAKAKKLARKVAKKLSSVKALNKNKKIKTPTKQRLKKGFNPKNGKAKKPKK